MGRINYGRVFLGALVAFVIYFIGDALIHGFVLGDDYAAMMNRLGIKAEEDPTAYAYFALFDYGKAFIAMMFYAAMRSRIGPGVKTAICAGLLAWTACEFVPAVGNMPLPLMGKWFHTKVMALELVPMVVGAIAGAWLYREEPVKTGP